LEQAMARARLQSRAAAAAAPRAAAERAARQRKFLAAREAALGARDAEAREFVDSQLVSVSPDRGAPWRGPDVPPSPGARSPPCARWGGGEWPAALCDFDLARPPWGAARARGRSPPPPARAKRSSAPDALEEPGLSPRRWPRWAAGALSRARLALHGAAQGAQGALKAGVRELLHLAVGDEDASSGFTSGSASAAASAAASEVSEIASELDGGLAGWGARARGAPGGGDGWGGGVEGTELALKAEALCARIQAAVHRNASLRGAPRAPGARSEAELRTTGGGGALPSLDAALASLSELLARAGSPELAPPAAGGGCGGDPLGEMARFLEQVLHC
jgi:hypothetical protein